MTPDHLSEIRNISQHYRTYHRTAPDMLKAEPGAAAGIVWYPSEIFDPAMVKPGNFAPQLPARERMTMAYEMAVPNHARILIVEDDPAIADMLVDLLRSSGFGASSVENGAAMDRLMAREQFDLIVLDAMLPGEDGFSICRRLRASCQVPILMLTALQEDIDRILGLELGADDYVTKPFNSRELLARIKSILRRASYAHHQEEALGPMTFSGWRIDPKSRQLLDADGAQVSMTTAEFDILLAFCCNPNQVLTREQLLSMTHAGSAGPVERSIDAHISRVRQKIEPNLKDPTFIKTVRLGGYLFASKVERLS